MTRPGYLGLGFKGFNTGDPSSPHFRPPNLQLAAGVYGGRFRARRTLLQQFDQWRRDADWHGGLAGADELRAGQAIDLLTAPRTANAFDLNKEAAGAARSLWQASLGAELPVSPPAGGSRRRCHHH